MANYLDSIEEREFIEFLGDLDNVRDYNALKRLNIRSFDELTQTTPKEILNTKGIGMTTFRHIVDALAKKGLELKDYN